jgi:hypothetical protein
VRWSDIYKEFRTGFTLTTHTHELGTNIANILFYQPCTRNCLRHWTGNDRVNSLSRSSYDWLALRIYD